MVDDQLLWKNHVDTTIAKVSKGIGMIRRMKSYVPKYSLMHVYNALIMPYFDYCSLVWDTCSNYLIENWQKLQKGLQGSFQAKRMRLDYVKFYQILVGNHWKNK